MQRGFSLVELSIVLVILGLLTGGILAGQSLIRAAELRAVSTEYQRWLTATSTFRDKYFALPGDFREATKFWGLQVVGSGCTSNHGLSTASSPGACDGSGTGIIGPATAASSSGKFVQFWRHLALAGLVEGNYSGLSGSGGAVHVTTDNSPVSKLSSGLWSTVWWAQQSGSSALYDGAYGNTLLIGRPHASAEPMTAIFRPEEMWNIDTKMDDGAPATGKMVVRSRQNCNVTEAGGTITAAAADAALFNARYNLANRAEACAAIFRGNF